MSDADFTKLHNELGAIFEGGLGFVALQAKDYAEAGKDFRQAVSEESQPNIADIYPLAQADLEAKPMNPEGFWFIVKAANLAQGEGKQQILDYGRKKYIRYHGSEQGWQELVTDATNNASVMPPQGFTVAAAPPPPSPAEQAADLVKNKDPKKMSFAEWQLVLSSGNQTAADTVWNTIKDKAVKLGASVISASASSLQLAGSEDDIEAKKADITVQMTKPIPAKLVPQPGARDLFPGNGLQLYPEPVPDDLHGRHSAGQERESDSDGSAGTPLDYAQEAVRTLLGMPKRELLLPFFVCAMPVLKEGGASERRASRR